MPRSAENAVSARSLSFLRPIFKTLRKGDVVLIRLYYANSAGSYETFLAEDEWKLKQVLRKALPRTIIVWDSLPYPWFKGRPEGLVPNEKGNLEYGAY